MSNAITISSGEDSDIEYLQTNNNNNNRGGSQDYINSGGVQLLGVTHNPSRSFNPRGNDGQENILPPIQNLAPNFHTQEAPLHNFNYPGHPMRYPEQHPNQMGEPMLYSPNINPPPVPSASRPPIPPNHWPQHTYSDEDEDEDYDTDPYEEFYTGDEFYSSEGYSSDENSHYSDHSINANGSQEHMVEVTSRITEVFNSGRGTRSTRGRGRGRGKTTTKGRGRGKAVDMSVDAGRGRGRGSRRGKATNQPEIASRSNRKTINNVVSDLGLNEIDSENEHNNKKSEQAVNVHFNANGLIDDHFSSSDDDQAGKTKAKPPVNKPVPPYTGTSKPNTRAGRHSNADIDDTEIFDLGGGGYEASEETNPSNKLEENGSSSPAYIINSQQSDYLGDGNIFEKFLDNDNPVIGLNDNATDQPDPQEVLSTASSPKIGNFEDFFLSSKALKRKETDSESDEKLPEIQLSQDLDSHKMKKRSPSIKAQKSTQDSKDSKIDDIEKYIEDGLRELEEEEILEQEKANGINQDPVDDILTFSRSPSISPPPDFLYSPPVQIIESQAPSSHLDNSYIKELDNLEKAMSDDSLEDLDPELLAIQEKARTQSSEAVPTDSKSKKKKGAKLTIACNMYKEPNDPDQFGDEFYEPIHFTIYEKDTFNRIIEVLSDIKRIPKQLLVLTYKNSQLFTLATPLSVNMNQPLNEVIVYIKGTYDKLLREKKLQLSELLTRESQTEGVNSAVDLTNEDENSPIAQQSQADPQEAGEEAPEDEFSDMFKPTEFFGIKLRNKSGKDSFFKVHSGTKLTSLVEAYISKNVLNIDPASVKLKFDGDPIELDQTVGDTEVEDGDLLDIFY